MEKYNKIDDFFKDNVSGFGIKPKNDSFDNIMKKYNQKRRRRSSKYLAIVISILFISGLIWLLSDNNNSQKPVSEKIIINKDLSTDGNSKMPDINILQEDSNVETLKAAEKENNDYTEQKNDITILTTSVESRKNQISHTSQTFKFSEKTLSLNLNNSQYFNQYDISEIYPYRVSLITQISSEEIPKYKKPVTVEEYIEKKKKIHLYTGISFSASLNYYGKSEDKSGWSSDLTVGYKINNFHIESGIGYEHQSQQGEVRIDYESNDSVGYYNKVVSFEVNPDKPEEIIYNTKKTIVYDSINHYLLQSPLYKYDYINIPVTVGYRFYNRESLTVSAETGIIYSILYKTHIPVILPNLNDVSIKGINNLTSIRRDNNFRLKIALRANYQVTDFISLSIQPEFTAFLNDINIKGSSFNEKPYSMGIRAGIFFNF